MRCWLDCVYCWVDAVGKIVIEDNNLAVGGAAVGPSALETVMNVSKEDARKKFVDVLFFCVDAFRSRDCRSRALPSPVLRLP